MYTLQQGLLYSLLHGQLHCPLFGQLCHTLLLISDGLLVLLLLCSLHRRLGNVVQLLQRNGCMLLGWWIVRVHRGALGTIWVVVQLFTIKVRPQPLVLELLKERPLAVPDPKLFFGAVGVYIQLGVQHSLHYL